MVKSIRQNFSRGSITVLTYHRIGEEKEENVLSVEQFKEQIKYILDKKIGVLDLKTYLEICTRKRSVRGKHVLITFDDGYRSVYENALPILKKYNLPAVLFVSPQWVEHGSSRDSVEKFCSVEELQEFAQNGVSIANHSYSHKQLGILSEQEARKEYVRAKEWIDLHIVKNSFGDVLAPPKGSWNENVDKLLKNEGLRYVFRDRVDVYSDKSIRYFKLSMSLVFKWFRKNRKFFWVLLFLVSIKIILGALLFLNIPNVGLPVDYYIPSGGDDISYVLASKDIFASSNSVGFPLFIALVSFITGLSELPQIALPIVFLNVFVLSTIAMVISVFIVRHFWKDIKYSVITGVFFIAIPYVWLLIFKDFSLTNASGAISPIGLQQSLHLFGLMVLTDWFGAVFALLGFLLFLKKSYVPAGILLGFSFLVRTQYVVPLILLSLVLFVQKKLKAFSLFVVSGIVGGGLQLVHNYHLSGSPFIFSAYTAEKNISTKVDGIGISNILSIPGRLLEHAPLVLPVLILVLVVIYFGIRYFWRDREKLLFLIAVGILTPGAFFLTAPAIRNPRYFLFLIPLAIIFFVSNYETIKKRFKQRA